MAGNASITTIRNMITDEAFRAMGFSYGSLVRKIFGPLMYPAARRFARLAAKVDADLEHRGIAETASKYLPDYVERVIINDAENIPSNGAAIIASNHPGTLDAPVILSALPRDDLKLIISGVPVVKALPGASKYLQWNLTPQGRRAYRKELIAILGDLENIKHDFTDDGRIRRMKTCIISVLVDIENLGFEDA